MPKSKVDKSFAAKVTISFANSLSKWCNDDELDQLLLHMDESSASEKEIMGRKVYTIKIHNKYWWNSGILSNGPFIKLSDAYKDAEETFNGGGEW